MIRPTRLTDSGPGDFGLENTKEAGPESPAKRKIRIELCVLKNVLSQELIQI